MAVGTRTKGGLGLLQRFTLGSDRRQAEGQGASQGQDFQFCLRTSQ